jgi:type IX secretion system PorP/SprF family membrane protein
VYFGFGLGAGMYSLRYDLTKINLKNNQDQLLYDLSKNGTSCSFLNVNAGLVLYSDRFRIAYSAMNLTKDLVRFEKNELFPAPVRNHTTNLAYKAKINNDFYLISSIESMFTRGISADHRISVNTLYKNFISAGLSYRPQKSMGIMVEARYSRYCFNYVFDYNTSQLSKFGNTGHQLGIKVFLKNINRMESYGW